MTSLAGNRYRVSGLRAKHRNPTKECPPLSSKSVSTTNHSQNHPKPITRLTRNPSHILNMEPHTSLIPGQPAPYGRACVSCSQAKCKCIIRAGGGRCERSVTYFYIFRIFDFIDTDSYCQMPSLRPRLSSGFDKPTPESEEACPFEGCSARGETG
jgi:hypothetical protein